MEMARVYFYCWLFCCNSDVGFFLLRFYNLGIQALEEESEKPGLKVRSFKKTMYLPLPH